jgi:hypothetical protein
VAGERGIDPPLAFAGAAAIVVESGLHRIAAFAQQVTSGDFEVEVGLDDLGGVGAGEEIGGLAVIVLGSDFGEDEPGVAGGLVLRGGQAERVAGAEAEGVIEDRGDGDELAAERDVAGARGEFVERGRDMAGVNEALGAGAGGEHHGDECAAH